MTNYEKSIRNLVNQETALFEKNFVIINNDENAKDFLPSIKESYLKKDRKHI